MDFAIRKRLEKLKNRRETKDDNDNFNLSPPPSPPRPPPLGPEPPRLSLGPPPAPPLFPPPSGKFLEPFQRPTTQPRPATRLIWKGFIGMLPVPSEASLSPNDYFLLGPSAPRPLTPRAPPLSPLSFTHSNNLYGSQTQTLMREKEEIKNAVKKEFDDKIYELPNDPPKLELEDGMANIIGPEAEDFLDERFVNKKRT